MKKETILQTIVWMKRLLGMVTVVIWGYIIFSIIRGSAPFNEQALYCMGSTMLIFGLLTVAFKGLDYWSLNNKT